MKRFLRRMYRPEIWTDRRFKAIRRLVIYAQAERVFGVEKAMRARRRFPMPVIW